MTTPILGITELSDGQVNQFSTCNSALRALEAAANDYLDIDLSSASNTLTPGEFQSAVIFRVSGNTVSRSVTLPANKRIFVISNGGSATLDVIIGSTTLTISASKSRMFYADGTTNGLALMDFS